MFQNVSCTMDYIKRSFWDTPSAEKNKKLALAIVYGTKVGYQKSRTFCEASAIQRACEHDHLVENLGIHFRNMHAAVAVIERSAWCEAASFNWQDPLSFSRIYY